LFVEDGGHRGTRLGEDRSPLGLAEGEGADVGSCEEQIEREGSVISKGSPDEEVGRGGRVGRVKDENVVGPRDAGGKMAGRSEPALGVESPGSGEELITKARFVAHLEYSPAGKAWKIRRHIRRRYVFEESGQAGRAGWRCSVCRGVVEEARLG
jgi:hypothetical protein